MHTEDICAGDSLGRYELLVPIAKGGTAEVWAARSKELSGAERIFAIKVLLSEYSDDIEAESMFFDEARLVSKINNPNVAAVLDIGETDTALFLVMEWIDGEPINVIAREARHKGGIPLAIAVPIICQAAAGLHAAHEARDHDGQLAGIVHRDVSPQNILVGYDGTVKVIDFGVAKATANQQRTNVGQLKGKVAYMSPEQALGEPVDRRADVFSLGIVLYQVATGKHPFRGDNEFATLGRIRDRKPVDPPRNIAPSIPPAVEQVILKALAKNRAERYGSMVELSRALSSAFPMVGDGTKEIAAFMGATLAARGERKRQAIREAIKAVEEDRAQSAVPAAFEIGKGAEPDGQWAAGPMDRAGILGTGSVPPPPSKAEPPTSAAFPPASAAFPPAPAAFPPASGAFPPAPRHAEMPMPPRHAEMPMAPRPAAMPMPPRPAEIPMPPRPAEMPMPPRPAEMPLAPPALDFEPVPRSTDGSLLPGKLVAPEVDLAQVPNFRRRGASRRLVFAAIAALLVVVALVVWGTTGDATDDQGATTGAPVKKPW